MHEGSNYLTLSLFSDRLPYFEIRAWVNEEWDHQKCQVPFPDGRMPADR